MFPLSLVQSGMTFLKKYRNSSANQKRLYDEILQMTFKYNTAGHVITDNLNTFEYISLRMCLPKS